MKKTLALVLALMLALTCVSAMAEIEGPHADFSIYPLVDEKISVTMTHMYTDVMPADWDTVWFWQQLEELTNVHLDMTAVPSSDRSTQLNLMLGSDDLPELLFKMSISSALISQYGAEGFFVDLVPYADVMPNFNFWLDAYPTAKNAITQVTGEIYGCPYILTGYAIRMGDRLFFNSQALEFAGLTTPPKTTEEYYEYLKAIKDYDYDNDPSTTTIPWGFAGYDDIDYILSGSFGLMNRGSSCYWFDQNEDGTARFWHTDDNYRKLLSYCNKLYEEGLIDPDMFTDDFAQLITKASTGRTLTYNFCNNSPVASSIYEQYTVPMTEPLEGPDGYKMWSNYSMPASTSSNCTITKEMGKEKIETMAKWADYFYSIEGIVAYFMGEENVSYTFDPETETYELTDMILHDPNGTNFEQVQSKWCTWAGGANPSCATNELFKGGETWPCSLESAAGLINYTPDAVYGAGSVWAPFVFDADTASEVAVLTADFSAYLEEYINAFIAGSKDIDNDADWAAYVDGFNALGVADYLDIINAKIVERGL